MISTEDKKISRVHCKIYHRGRLQRGLQDEQWEVLKGYRRKQCPLSRLDKYALSIILRFLAPDRSVYVEDCGSVRGTYIKVNGRRPLAKFDQILAYAQEQITVLNIYSRMDQFLLESQSPDKYFPYLSFDIYEELVIQYNENQFIQYESQLASLHENPCILLLITQGELNAELVEKQKVVLVGEKNSDNLMSYHLKSNFIVQQNRNNVNQWEVVSDASQSEFIWINASKYKFSSSNHTPQKTLLNNGDEILISESRFQVLWFNSITGYCNQAQIDEMVQSKLVVA